MSWLFLDYFGQPFARVGFSQHYVVIIVRHLCVAALRKMPISHDPISRVILGQL